MGRGRAALGVLLGAALAVACAGPGAERQPFRDATAESGLDFVHFSGRSGELYFCEMMGPGAALFDYDGDGDLDLFFVQGSMLGKGKTLADALDPPRHTPPFADRLYRNDLEAAGPGRARARFRDVTGATPERSDGYGMGVAVGDIDNDGDPDLYVTSLGPDRLMRNRGDGTFEDVTAAAGADDPRWSTSASFADLDRDGWLDLYVANYVDYTPDLGKECHTPAGVPDYCGPQVYEPETHRLFHNRGDGTFEDATLATGVHAAAGNGLGVVAADYDGDDRVDLYVANDLMANFLWRNQGDGTLREEGLERGCALNIDGLAESSMGVDAGDADGDGDEDLFMTHIAEQTNTFYRNDGAGMFLDSTAVSGLGAPSAGHTGFGSVFVDYDLDGDLDLVSVTGGVKLIRELLAAGDPVGLGQEDQLFENEGDGRFTEVLPRPAPLATLAVGRGLAVGDVDGDGDSDLAIGNNNAPARLLLGEPPPAHWLGLRLRAEHGPDSLPGTRTVLEVGGRSLSRRVRADGSYLSANDPRIHFGAGEAARFERLDVFWSDGTQMRLLEPPADRYLVLLRRAA